MSISQKAVGQVIYALDHTGVERALEIVRVKPGRSCRCEDEGCFTRSCCVCKQPPREERLLFAVDLKLLQPGPAKHIDRHICGDCMGGGVALANQLQVFVPEPPPLENYHAWSTPAYDGVGKL